MSEEDKMPLLQHLEGTPEQIDCLRALDWSRLRNILHICRKTFRASHETLARCPA